MNVLTCEKPSDIHSFIPLGNTKIKFDGKTKELEVLLSNIESDLDNLVELELKSSKYNFFGYKFRIEPAIKNKVKIENTAPFVYKNSSIAMHIGVNKDLYLHPFINGLEGYKKQFKRALMIYKYRKSRHKKKLPLNIEIEVWAYNYSKAY